MRAGTENPECPWFEERGDRHGAMEAIRKRGEMSQRREPGVEGANSVDKLPTSPADLQTTQGVQPRLKEIL